MARGATWTTYRFYAQGSKRYTNADIEKDGLGRMEDIEMVGSLLEGSFMA